MNAIEKEFEITHSKPADEWRIGYILIRSGRLKKDDVAKIVQRQIQKGVRFGDAAIELGMLTVEDVRFGLARQFDISYVAHGESNISKQVIAAYEPASPSVEPLRALRSQLMHEWFDAENTPGKATAIVGADRGAGRSWLAANLAVTFSQLGKRTVLIDADLRHASQHLFFGLENHFGLSQILCERVSPVDMLEQNQVLPNLTVITAGITPPNPQEVISRGGFNRLIDSLRKTSDVIIFDTPANSDGVDGQIVAKFAGSAILLAKRHSSRAAELTGYIASLRGTGTKLLASVLT